jgi:hypothetical protein
LSDDLLQKVNDTLFDNPFTDQHRFDYSKPNNNEDDKTLNLNMIVNIDNDVDNDIDDEIIPHILCCNPILDPPRFSQMLFYFYYYL